MFRIAVIWLLAFTTQVEAAAVSLWQWKDIRLRLEAGEDQRTLLYHKVPADFAARAGIAPGATFWEGRRLRDRPEGNGYLPGKGCTPVSFNMAGNARLNTKGEIVFTASPLKRNAAHVHPDHAPAFYDRSLQAEADQHPYKFQG